MAYWVIEVMPLLDFKPRIILIIKKEKNIIWSIVQAIKQTEFDNLKKAFEHRDEFMFESKNFFPKLIDLIAFIIELQLSIIYMFTYVNVNYKINTGEQLSAFVA